MIEIKGLRKEFGPFVAVDNVSFTVEKGEVLGFLGPNGAGKSTTMKMLTGFLTPTRGTARICGADIQQDPLTAKRRIGYLPEGAPAYSDMTPASFLRFIGQIRGFSGAELTRRVDEAVTKTSLESHYYQPIETLSKGFKRRVGLAQAILHDPDVLIMDEPTDGLDPNQKHEVRNLITAMAKNKAIVLSTHILEEVEAICTRAVIIAAGRVIADGTPEALAARSESHNAVTLTMPTQFAAGAKSKLEKIAGVEKVTELGAKGASTTYFVQPQSGRTVITDITAAARENGWPLEEVRAERGRLDEVFRAMTADVTAKAGRES